MNGILAAGPEGLAGYLIIAAALFALGVLACVLRRNAVGFLIGVELMLNGAALNFVAFDRFQTVHGPGQIMSLFVIALAAAEAAVALALVYGLYRTTRDVDLEDARELRG